MVTAPRTWVIREVEPPVPGPGQVVVDVHRVGVCGTDVELFSGDMAYLHQGHAHFPIRLGHEWMGVVGSLGDGVDSEWLGRRVTGDTMLGCGHCRLCTGGRQHVCHDRFEIGIRGDWPGALAEQLLVPSTALHALPDSVDDMAGALVEPGGNAMRAVRAAAVEPGSRVLVYGPGTIGLLTAMIAESDGVEAHLAGRSDKSLDFARSIGLRHTWRLDQIPDLAYDAVIDCTFGAELPSKAVSVVQPGGRVVLIGLSGTPSLVDTRELVLKDLTTVGILSGSPGLAQTIEYYADGRVDPRPIVAGTVGLGEAGAALAGESIVGIGPGPKIHINPRT